MKPDEDRQKLLFMHIRGEDLGFFIFPQFYYIALNFFSARQQAATWGEFWSSLDSRCRDFLQPFMQNDDVKPEADSKIENLYEMWIFHDSEFPMTQLAEETYTEIKESLPLDLMSHELRTEYHHHIGIFPTDRFESLRAHLGEAGIEVDKVVTLVPIDFRHY
jgi:hypothetical protein